MPEENESLGEMLGAALQVVVKRRWWLIIPACAIALITCLIAAVLPKRYQSDATILVERQQVPERYVVPTSTADPREALQAMTQAILSRTQLLQIVDEFDLYPKKRKRLAPEELVKLMRADITIEPLEKTTDPNKQLNAFKISFTCNEAHLAQAVTSRFTTLFIDENLRSREEQATGTTNFLTDQVATAATQLRRQEARVRDFKMRNLGELPEQQQGNLQILSGLHMQLQQTMAAASHAREQQAYLETLLSHYRDLPTETESKPAAPAPSVSSIEAVQTELTRLKSQRADLLARYTSKYPDVQKLDEQIAETEARLARLSAEAAEHPAEQPAGQNPAGGGTSGREATVAQLKSQLEANRIEIQNAVAEQKNLEERIADYQRRLNMTPVREQELADMLRDYSLSKQNYDDLLNKKTQSLLATSLEKHQQGQQFRIVDAPSLPIKPVSPDVLQICLLGLAGGLAVGIGMAYFAESKDDSIRDDKEVRKSFPFPLVISLPLILGPSETNAAARTKKLEWVAGVTLALVVCVTEFLVLRRG